MLFKQLIIASIFLMSCNTGKLNVVADIPKHLKEVSATETIPNSDLIWVIEDGGNKNTIYGLDTKGAIVKEIDISNADNDDWEDLTSDKLGNLYIGDFGNNNKKRDEFTIYKVSNPDTKSSSATAERIIFSLPKKMKSEDFEGFFLLNDYFYIFSKENNSSKLIKVPNRLGKHTAELVNSFNLHGKHLKVTSADVSDDGKTIVLLNHDKLWKITNYNRDDFFNGSIEALDFGHNSQKEGICFLNDSIVLITDESNGNLGSNIYSFKIN